MLALHAAGYWPLNDALHANWSSHTSFQDVDDIKRDTSGCIVRSMGNVFRKIKKQAWQAWYRCSYGFQVLKPQNSQAHRRPPTFSSLILCFHHKSSRIKRKLTFVFLSWAWHVVDVKIRWLLNFKFGPNWRAKPQQCYLAGLNGMQTWFHCSSAEDLGVVQRINRNHDEFPARRLGSIVAAEWKISSSGDSIFCLGLDFTCSNNQESISTLYV